MNVNSTRRPAMTSIAFARVASKMSLAALLLASVAAIQPAQAADRMLSGTVANASGEKIAGATVSAKADGSSITTSVFTDEQGNYYFPEMPAGKYRVWAQAVTFDTGRGNVDLATSKHQDFKLAAMKDFVPQLTGDVLIASLPEDTPDDARIKRVIRNNCTGCHTPNYPLQHRFDEKGWTAIL